MAVPCLRPKGPSAVQGAPGFWAVSPAEGGVLYHHSQIRGYVYGTVNVVNIVAV